MVKNVTLAGKDAESFDVILQEDHLPMPKRWDAEITDSTVSPFSDKLMMYGSVHFFFTFFFSNTRNKRIGIYP
ncbi:DUF3231 family protein [Bacillus salipaludis]|nr:DUF3231 family protein [Bacillus salipaludis]